MNSRQFMKEEILLPQDLVNMVIELMPKLTMIDLQILIMQAELELAYRSTNNDENI